MPFRIPTKVSTAHWTRRGVALLTSLDTWVTIPVSGAAGRLASIFGTAPTGVRQSEAAILKREELIFPFSLDWL